MKTIYGLAHPQTGELGYIGATGMLLRARLSSHLSDKTRTKRSKWINGLISNGLRPEIFVIEECQDEEAFEKEVFWMNYFSFIGCNLFNTKDLHPEFVKRSQAWRGNKMGIGNTVRLGKLHTEATKKKMSEGQKRCIKNGIRRDCRKLKDGEIDLIRSLALSGINRKMIGKMFKISVQTVFDIKTGRGRFKKGDVLI